MSQFSSHALKKFCLLLGVFVPSAILGAPVFLQTDSATAPVGAGGLGTLFQIRKLTDGTKLVMGTATSGFGKVNSAGDTYTTINYDVALGGSPNEFIVSGSSMFINNSTTLSRYDISGATANFVANITVPTGATSMSLNNAGNLLLGKGTTLRTISVTDLSTIGSDLTSSAAMVRNGVNASDAHIYLTSTGILRKFITGTSDDVIIVNALGSGGSAHKSLVVMPDSTAYVAPVVSGAGAIKKINSTGTILWSKSVANTMVAMTIDSAGIITVLNSTGTIDNYLPVKTPTSFSGTPTSASINLQWTTGVTDADFSGVTIRRSTSSYPSDPTSGSIVSSDDTNVSFADSGLTADTTYYYSIWNKSSDGFFGQPVNLSIQTVFAPPSFSASASGSTVALSWTIPTGVGSFTIRKSTSGYPTSISDGSAVASNLDASVTTYNDTSLAEGTYYYSLFAQRSSDSAYADPAQASVSVDTTPPSAPALSAVKAAANGNTINLTWDVPATTNTFTLKKVVNGAVETTVQTGIASSTTTYSQTGLSDGDYVYKIYAVDSAGNISSAGVASSLTIDTTAPSAPTSFVVGVAGSTVNLSWINPVSDFSSVTVRRSSSAYPSSASDGTGVVSNSTSTSYSDIGLADGVYYYSIFAIDNYGNTSTAANVSATVDTTAPAAPSLSASKPTTNGSTINLTWDVPSTTSTFILKVIYNSGSESTVQTGIASSTTSSSQTGLTDGTYIYKIYAVDSVGNVSNAGVSTSVTIDTTATSAPSGLTLSTNGTAVNLSTVGLNWTNPVASDFASITIRRDTTGYPSSVSSGTDVASALTTTSYSDSNLADGTYYYSVFSMDSFGNISTAAQATLTIETNTALEISVQAPSATSSFQVNDDLRFTLSIGNSGNRDANSTELTFALSSNLQFVSAELITETASASTFLPSSFSSTSVSCTGSPTLTCNIGTVPAGETLSLLVLTRVLAAGSISFSVSGTDGISANSTSSTGTAVDGISVNGSEGGCSLNSKTSRPLRPAIPFIALATIGHLLFRRRIFQNQIDESPREPRLNPKA